METNLTNNKNSLFPGNFKVTIDRTEYANIEFFCTKVNLPGLTKAAVEQKFRDRPAFFPGGIVNFDEITITFIVDEDMVNYREIFDWITEGDRVNPKFRDITLSILTNKNTTGREILFHDTFPTSLSGIDFDASAVDASPITCTAIFKFNTFEFKK